MNAFATINTKLRPDWTMTISQDKDLQGFADVIGRFRAGLAGLEPGDKLVVAMSGGVDSSLVAALAHRLGFHVIAITLQLYDHGEARGRPGSCCAGRDSADARSVAQQFGFAHYVLDFEERFQRTVIDAFTERYAKGETPVPCAQCNQHVKFDDLLTHARKLGGKALLTGHYVQRWHHDCLGHDQPGPGGAAQLGAAIDDVRDQSWFLFSTPRRALEFLRFPLGQLHKHETRDLAAALGLCVAHKPDSQDICFVPDGDYAGMIRKLRPQAAEPGEICDLAGQVLGRHPGIIHYTIGQRRGLGIGGLTGAHDTKPCYVVAIDAETRRVTVGPREALGVSGVCLRDVNWLGASSWQVGKTLPLTVKFRSTMQPVQARLDCQKDGRAEVHFEALHYGVSPGQPCVFYDGTRMLGGGWIEATSKPGLPAGTLHHPRKDQPAVIRSCD
ncbi:MAG: tRNA 2-thiouridine(34) synthase MnmA [Pseudomonadota bacterium]